MSLGHAYKDLPAIRNLKLARQWYRRAIKHRSPQDLLGRARGWYQLSLVAFERLREAQAAELSLRQKERFYRVSLALVNRAAEATPRNAVNDLVVIHHHLGALFTQSDRPNLAFGHFQESIRLEELRGDHYGAAVSRLEIAKTFFSFNRFSDALVFAQAALTKLRALGPAGLEKMHEAEAIIANIKKHQKY